MKTIYHLRYLLITLLLIVPSLLQAQTTHTWKNFSVKVPEGWTVMVIKDAETYLVKCYSKDAHILLNQAIGERNTLSMFGNEKVEQKKLGAFDATTHTIHSKDGQDLTTQIEYAFNVCGSVILITTWERDKDHEKNKAAFDMMKNSFKCK